MDSSDYEQNLSGTRTRIPVRRDAEIAPSCSEPVELLEFQLEESEKLSCSELVERFQVTSDNPDISFEKVTKMHRLKWMQDKVHRAEVCNE